jgi:hypothetical protein
MNQARNRANNLLKSALLILFGLTAVVGAFLLYDAPRPSCPVSLAQANERAALHLPAYAAHRDNYQCR